MRAVGIVAEYNPFHSGHGYHIEETRRLMGPVPVIAVMSGDFVQRGEAAVFDKHTRAGAAVLGGADLVIDGGWSSNSFVPEQNMHEILKD